MAADGKNRDDLDMQGRDPADDVIDIDDFSEVDQPMGDDALRAGDRYSGAQNDDSGDPDESGDFVEEESSKPKRGASSKSMTKVLAPALVLVAAAGIGGYIVMNPHIISGKGPQPVAPSQAEMPVAQAPVETPLLPEPEMAALPSEALPTPLAELPQPVATQNEPVTSAPVDAVAVDAVPVEAPTETLPMPDAPPPADLAAATGQPMPAEVVPPSVSDTTQVLPIPESGPVEEVKPLEAAGTVETVVTPPETVAALDLPTPTVTPTPAPVAETPAATPPVMPEQPTAAPPVMNVQESAAAMPPTTDPLTPVPTTPSASEGSAAASVFPTEPAPDEADVYYDSAYNVPSGPLASTVGPRAIDPVMEPASKMVVVKRGSGPGSFEATLVAANRALKLGRNEAALEMFDGLYKKNARDERVVMGRAVAQQGSGLIESAIMSYEEALALNPKNTNAMINMLGLIRAQYPEVALRRLMDLYEKYPNNAGIAAQAGIISAEVSRFDDAMKYLGIAATLEPRNAQHYFNMGITAERLGDRINAIKYYEKALEIDAMYGANRSIPRESIYDRLSVLRR